MAENSAPPDFDEMDTRPMFSARHVSIKRLHELTGFDRNTIKSWIDKGCPVVSAGERGTDYVLDIRAVWKWREREVAKATGANDEDSDWEFMGVKDPTAAAKFATAMSRIFEAAKEQKELVMVDAAAASFARAMSLVRQAVMAIPDRCARDLAGFPKEKVSEARLAMISTCKNALDGAAASLAKSIETSR